MQDDNAHRRAGDTPPEPRSGWPRISDYWPDAAPRHPPADHHERRSAEPAPGTPAHSPADRHEQNDPEPVPATPADRHARRGPEPVPGTPADRHARRGPEPASGTPARSPAPPRRRVAPVRTHRDQRAGARRRWWKPVLGAALAVAVTSGALVLTRTTGMITTTGRDPGREPPATAGEPPSPAAPARTISVPPSPASSPVVTTDPPAPPASAAPRPPRPPAPPFTAGTFELVDSTTELNVTLRPLGAEVFRAGAPTDSSATPSVTVRGSTVRLDVKRNAKPGRARVDLELNREIAWSVRMTGGVEQGTFDLSRGRVRRVDLTGGATRLALVVPDQPTALPIRMTGGVNTWRIETAGEPNARVLLREGGGEVRLGERRVRGIARGTTLTAGGGEPAGRLDIDAVAGLGTLTVVRASAG